MSNEPEPRNPSGEKICPQCQIPKLLTAFPKDRTSKDGYATYCLDCAKDRSQRWRKNHRNQVRAQNKAWKLANPEKVKQCNKEQRQLHDYGLLPGEGEVLFKFQKGCCAICGEPLSIPYTDHNHLTGETRGLLCWPCNNALGKFHDNPILLRRAAVYLEQFPVPLALGSRRFGLPGRIDTSRKNRRTQARDALTVGLVPADAYRICAPDIEPASEITTAHQRKLVHLLKSS